MNQPLEPPKGVELFDTPEEAALSGWRSTPSSKAHVVKVEPRTVDEFGGLWVTVRTDGHRLPGYQPYDHMISVCLQTADGRWWENGSSG